MSLHYKLRHRIFSRTRVQFPLLRNKEPLCAAVQLRLRQLPGVSDVVVRPRTGSIILSHPEGPVAIEEVVALVAKTPNVTASSSPLAFRPPQKRDREKIYHVSGWTLLLTGGYLLYLFAKNLFSRAPVLPAATSVVGRFFTVPAVVASVLAAPVVGQAVANWRRHRTLDMGMISTALLVASMAMGNVVAALTVFWLFNLSSWLENRIRIHTRQAVRDMLAGRSRNAWLLVDAVETEVPVTSLQPGDVVVVRRGEVFPVDGVIVEGLALVNEATMTGEPLPVSRDKGSRVLAGTVLEEGEVQVRAEKTGEQTRLAAIIRCIEEAENDPGQLQRVSERFSRTMVPVSLLIAGLVFVYSGSLVQAMVVLIISCPCVLRLSTSVAVSSAMAVAATDSVFIKGGRYVELAGRTNVLVLDKTGTITETASEVTEVVLFDQRFKEQTLLQLAASAQKYWAHPLSRAVLAKAEQENIPLLPARNADLLVGQGVCAEIGGQEVLVGNHAFMQGRGVHGLGRDSDEKEIVWRNDCLLVARDRRLLGMLQTQSRLRDQVNVSLQKMRTLGIHHIVLLTGDGEAGVADLGEQLAVDEVHWAQTPEQKAAWIKQWKDEHPEDVVAMVGDGINDAPAFAAADLSLAIGEGGSDVAVEYCDIVLQRGGVTQVAAAFELGRDSLQVITESYALALGMNSLALFLTSFGMIPAVAGAVFHNAATVAAVVNAAKLRRQHGRQESLEQDDP
ncbi:MAG: hypothetical protein CSA21_07550 [Deltaproteobacteria bacterium]|nr:MAG: hypothetical protein CSA21_07550 [Deltaproteobacteria bacterium]